LNYLYLHDIIPTLIKSVIFGFSIGIIGCYYGYNTTKGAVGVGAAAHSAVVLSSLSIFLIDFDCSGVITYILYRCREIGTWNKCLPSRTFASHIKEKLF